jgi:hypothetical protein
MGTSVHVQTFLPYADFARTAEVLDRTRLGKQRVECIQIVRALTIPTYGWRHHPAALMWRGHLEALGAYSFAIIDEWTRQGHADTCATTIAADLAEAGVTDVRTQYQLAAADALPSWLGDPDFHVAHQSSLVRKDPEHYGRFFPGIPDDLPYVWPLPD